MKKINGKKIRLILFIALGLIVISSTTFVKVASASSPTSFLYPTNNYGYYGGGANALNNPYDSLIDSTHHRLFVSDFENNRILVYNLDNNDHLTSQNANYVIGQPDFNSNSSGTTASKLWNPLGLAYDSTHQRLFVSDSNNNRVLVYDLSGGISNGMAAVEVIGQTDFTSNTGGTSSSQFFDNAGLYYDGSKYLYVADSQNNRVMVFDLSGGISNGMAAVEVIGQTDFTSNTGGHASNQLFYPYEVSYDSSDNYLLISDYSNSRVLAYDLSGGPITNMSAVHVIGQPDFNSIHSDLNANSLNSPGSLTYDSADKYLFVSDYGSDRVLVYNLSNGITDGMAASHVIGEPNFTSNNSYPDFKNGLYDPWGITYDPLNKNIIVSDVYNSRVNFYDLSQGIIDGMSPYTNLGGILSWSLNTMAIDHVHHRMFVNDSNYSRILVYALNDNDQLINTIPEYVIGKQNLTDSSTCSSISISTICSGFGLNYDSSLNDLFVSDFGANRVLVYNFNSGISNGMNASYVLGQPDFTSHALATTISGLNNPEETVYDSKTRQLLVSDSSNNRVLVYNIANGISNGMNASYVLGQPDFTSSAAATTQNGFNYPGQMTIDYNHNRLYVSDYNNNRILVFDLNNGISNGMNASYVLGQPDFTSSAAATTQNGFSSNWGVAYDNNNDRLFVGDTGNNRVLGFDLSNGIINGMNASWVFGETSFTDSSNNNSQYPGLSNPYDVNYDPYNNYLWTQTYYMVYNYDLTSMIGGKSLATETPITPSNSNTKTPNTGFGSNNSIDFIPLIGSIMFVASLSIISLRLKKSDKN